MDYDFPFSCEFHDPNWLSLHHFFQRGRSTTNQIIYIYTLWLFNIAMENGPFIDDFPINTSIYKGFSMAMLNNQMIYYIPWCHHHISIFHPQYFILDYLKRIFMIFSMGNPLRLDPLGESIGILWFIFLVVPYANPCHDHVMAGYPAW